MRRAEDRRGELLFALESPVLEGGAAAGACVVRRPDRTEVDDLSIVRRFDQDGVCRGLEFARDVVQCKEFEIVELRSFALYSADEASVPLPLHLSFERDYSTR